MEKSERELKLVGNRHTDEVQALISSGSTKLIFHSGLKWRDLAIYTLLSVEIACFLSCVNLMRDELEGKVKALWLNLEAKLREVSSKNLKCGDESGA